MQHEDAIHQMDEKKFKALVARKTWISVVLTIIMLGIYYGFILVLAFDKALLSKKIGEHMTLGIPIGLGVIAAACIMTGLYVWWANTDYDKSVNEVVQSMRRSS